MELVRTSQLLVTLPADGLDDGPGDEAVRGIAAGGVAGVAAKAADFLGVMTWGDACVAVPKPASLATGSLRVLDRRLPL